MKFAHKEVDEAVTKLLGIYGVRPIEKVIQSSNVKLSDHSSSGNEERRTMSFKEILAKASENYTEEEIQRTGCYSGLGVELYPAGYSIFDARG